MYILGIHHKHDASACLIKNGKLVAMAEEERFSRRKHHAGFPFRSIEFVLGLEKISMRDIDYVAFGNLPPKQANAVFFSNYLANGAFLMDGAGSIRNVYAHVKNHLTAPAMKQLSRIAPHLKKEQVGFVEHHLAHASSAFRCSGYPTSSILTFDAWGDMTTTTQGVGRDNKIEIFNRVMGVNSLGFMYSAFTRYLGYPSGWGHEGKVMGLAAYGAPTFDFSDVIQLRGGGFKTNPQYAYGKYALKNIVRKFGPAWSDSYTPFGKRHADIASTLQKKLEEAAINLVKETMERSGSEDLCLAGGVALNCKMNGEIRKHARNLFVQPAAGDEGKPLGAAMQLYAELGRASNFRLEHAYWGPSFSDEEIQRVLDEKDLAYEKHDDIEGVAADLVQKGNIVGWFQGRMEVGPRALGNRSLIADPTNEKMKEIINQRVKDREIWRPFAPSVLERHASEYFEDCKSAPFMIVAYDVVEDKRKEIPAVVHVDGTARPQTVSKKTNPRYYRLIEEFEKRSGIPVVLNTSFNEKEPIVCTPSDAINTYLNTGINCLALGSFLLKKA